MAQCENYNLIKRVMHVRLLKKNKVLLMLTLVKPFYFADHREKYLYEYLCSKLFQLKRKHFHHLFEMPVPRHLAYL